MINRRKKFWIVKRANFYRQLNIVGFFYLLIVKILSFFVMCNIFDDVIL